MGGADHGRRRGKVCGGSDWRVSADVLDHGNRLGFPEAFRQRSVCLGYRFECAEGAFGDTVDCPGLRRLVPNADILVSAAISGQARSLRPRRGPWPTIFSPVPTRWDTLRPRRGSGLVLTHHRQKPYELLEQPREAMARDFTGKVLLGPDGLRVVL